MLALLARILAVLCVAKGAVAQGAKCAAVFIADLAPVGGRVEGGDFGEGGSYWQQVVTAASAAVLGALCEDGLGNFSDRRAALRWHLPAHMWSG